MHEEYARAGSAGSTDSTDSTDSTCSAGITGAISRVDGCFFEVYREAKLPIPGTSFNFVGVVEVV